MKSRYSAHHHHHYLSSSFFNRMPCHCSLKNSFLVYKLEHVSFSTTSGDFQEKYLCRNSPLCMSRRCISLSEIAKVFTDMGSNGVDSCNSTWNNTTSTSSSSVSSSSPMQSSTSTASRLTRNTRSSVHTNQSVDRFSERYLYEHRRESNANSNKFDEGGSTYRNNSKYNSSSMNGKSMRESPCVGTVARQSSNTSNVPSVIQTEFNVQFATLLTSLHEEQLCSMLQRSRREFNYGNMILGLLEVYRRVQLQLCVTRTFMESMPSRQRASNNTNNMISSSHNDNKTTINVETEDNSSEEIMCDHAKISQWRRPELITFRELTPQQQRQWSALSFIYTPIDNNVLEREHHYYKNDKRNNEYCKAMPNMNTSNDAHEREDTLRCITTDRMLATLLSILTKVRLSEIDHDVNVWLASDEYSKLTHAEHNEWLPHELQITLQHRSFSHELSSIVERWLVARVSDWDVHECIFFLHLLSQQNAIYHEGLLATLADTIMLHSHEIHDYNEFSALFDVMVRAQLELNNVTHLYEWEGAAQHTLLHGKEEEEQKEQKQQQENTNNNRNEVQNTTKRKKRSVNEQNQSSLWKHDRAEKGRKDRVETEIDDNDDDNEEEELENRLRRAMNEKTLQHPIYNELFYNTIAEQMTRCLIHDELGRQSHHSNTTHSTENMVESCGSSKVEVNNTRKTSLLPLMHEKVAPTLSFAQLPPISFLFLTRALAKLAFFHSSVSSALLPHLRSYLRLHPAHFKTVTELLGRKENTSVDASVFVILMHNILTLLRRRGQTYAREMHMRANLQEEMAFNNSFNSNTNTNISKTKKNNVGVEIDKSTIRNDNNNQQQKEQEHTIDKEDAYLEEFEKEPSASSNDDNNINNKVHSYKEHQSDIVKPIKNIGQPHHFMLSFIPLNGLIKFVEALQHQYSLVMSNSITSEIPQSLSLSSPPEKSIITKTAITYQMKEVFLLLLTDVHRGTRSIDTLSSELTTLSLEKLLEVLLEFSFTLESDNWSTSTTSAKSNTGNEGKVEWHPLMVELMYCWTRQVSTCVKRSRSDASYLLFHPMCYSVTWQRRTKTLLSYCLHYRLLMETNNPGRYTIPDEVLECAPRVQGAILGAKHELKRHVLQNAKSNTNSNNTNHHDMRRRKLLFNEDIHIHTSALFARFSAAMEFARGNSN